MHTLIYKMQRRFSKRHSTVYQENISGSLNYLIEVESGDRGEYLRLQPKPYLYPCFVPGWNLKNQVPAPLGAENIARTIIPAYLDYRDVHNKSESINNKIYFAGIEGKYIDPLWESEKQAYLEAINQFWVACDRLYLRLIKEFQLTSNQPREKLEHRLSKIQALLDAFDEVDSEVLS